MLTQPQLLTLNADIAADPALSAFPETPDGAYEIATVYNQIVTPDYWVWRTRVTRDEIVGVTTPSPDNTMWSWTIYIARSQGERDAWREMFTEDIINYARLNVRQGLQDIFSGTGGATQRTHLLRIGRRLSTRAEQLFAVGAGTTVSPATMGFEGALPYEDVATARALS